MPSPTVKLAVFVVLFATAGCSSIHRWHHNGKKVGPNYCRPIVPTADAWIDEDRPEVEPVFDRHEEWWRLFNDAVLDQLVMAGYQQNLDLRTASLRVLEARRQRQIAAANLFPQTQAAFGQYSRRQNSFEVANVFPGIARNISQWDTGFDLSWEIDVWGRIRRSIEAADATIDAEIELYDDVLVTLIGDIVSTYIEIRSFDERIGLAESNAEIQLGSYNLAAARFREGAVSKLDVYQATSNLADTKALIPTFELGRRQAVNRLAILLGMTPQALDPMLAARGRMPQPPKQVVVGIPADLLRRRPDVRAAEREIAVLSAQIGIAEAELYPQFGLNGDLALSAQNFSDLFSSTATSGFIAPGFRWKILNYGRLVNNVRVQELRYQQAILRYESVVLAAHREVEDAIVEFLRAKEREDELAISAEAAAESVDLVRLQYTEGNVDFGRVFVVEAILVERQDQLVATRSQVSIAVARLYKALGGGWQLRNSIPYVGQGELTPVAESIETPPTTEDAPEIAPLPPDQSE